MASKQTYPCFACRKAGYEIPVYLDGKDAEGHTKYLNEDGTKHIHKGKEQDTESSSSVATTTTESMSMKIINAKLDRIIALLGSQKK